MALNAMLKRWVSLGLLCFLPTFAVKGEELRVLAPASLGAVAHRIEALSPGLHLILGPTSQLVRQVEQGLEAHILITANADWMDEAEKRGLIIADSRAVFVKNAMVLAANAPRSDIKALGDLKDILTPKTRVALCGPGPVPCGIYAKTALEKLNLWRDVEPFIVYAKDAAATRHFVESGVVDMGFLYKSDAVQSNVLHILSAIDTDLSGSVVYELAILTGADRAKGQGLKKWLLGDEVRTILEQTGFVSP